MCVWTKYIYIYISYQLVILNYQFYFEVIIISQKQGPLETKFYVKKKKNLDHIWHLK